MQQNAETDAAHNPRGTTKISMTYTLICNISSEVRAGLESE